MSTRRVTDRRALLGMLAGAAAGTLAACHRGPAPGPSTSTRTPSAGSTPTASSPTGPTPSAPAPSAQALPASTRWMARDGEVEPQVKAIATGLVQAVATWPAGQGGLAAARARVAALGQDAALADACAPLVGTDAAASSRVVDAQYGGILTSTSSVLVVLDQWRLDAAGLVHPGGTTLDVRLERAGRRWRVVDVFPARPGRAATAVPALARQVLGDARIRLPYAAHADVATGQISSSVLGTLLAMAQHWLVDVSVVRSGHPFYVFGTSRPSDHPKGHAVDVWALDGGALVEPVHHQLAVDGMRLAVAQGGYNVGGPVLLSGPQYFSDRTHQDHIHLGFRG